MLSFEVMLKTRLIAVLIVLDGQVVQSVRFKHTNVIHYDPIHAIEAFNQWAVDEIVILNVSRNPETRDAFADTVANISTMCYVPLAAGGWITDAQYAQRLLRSGADKIVVNSIIWDDPQLVTELSRRYGKQCVVASIDVQRIDDVIPQVVADRGRKPTGIGAVEGALRAVDAGAGEILFNSIDHDGARKGYDTESIRAISEAVDVPVIAFGGVLKWDHLLQGIEAGADAVAVANQFHYTEQSTKKAKAFLAKADVTVREEGRFGGNVG